MVASKHSIATRKEIKVLKKPLASWTQLVAMISVPICARVDPLDPHRLSLLSRPILGFTPAEPIHPIRIRLPVEAVQGYRQGDGRYKSCQSAQLRRYRRGPDNRPRKESGSRRVPFLKTAPIINWPVCPW
jgi:hypothetical protein